MSSYSGEVGLPYRTAYCASKFAVTGFFESLRMEVSKDIDITIICPVSINTEFREHSLLKGHDDEVHLSENVNPNSKKSKVASSVEEVTKVCLLSIDRKARKVLFPTTAWFSAYIRPLFPDFIDNKL